MKPGITVLGFLFLCLVLNACMTPVRGDAFVTYKNESGLGTLNRIFSYTHENNHILRREMKSNRTYGYFIKNGYIEVIFEADIAPPSFTIYNNGVLTKTVDCIAKYDCGAELYPRDSLVVKMSQRKQ